MHQSCRLQSMTLALPSQVGSSKLAEFRVNKGSEVGKGLLVAPHPFAQKPSHSVSL